MVFLIASHSAMVDGVQVPSVPQIAYFMSVATNYRLNGEFLIKTVILKWLLSKANI